MWNKVPEVGSFGSGTRHTKLNRVTTSWIQEQPSIQMSGNPTLFVFKEGEWNFSVAPNQGMVVEERERERQKDDDDDNECR